MSNFDAFCIFTLAFGPWMVGAIIITIFAADCTVGLIRSFRQSRY